jgi:hypothetical protein
LPTGDEFARPHEVDAAEVHPASTEHFNEVLANVVDLREVAAHLVIQPRKEIGNQKNHPTPGASDRICVERRDQSLGDVHSAAWLESIVRKERRLLREDVREAAAALRVFCDPQKKINALLHRQRGSHHSKWSTKFSGTIDRPAHFALNRILSIGTLCIQKLVVFNANSLSLSGLCVTLLKVKHRVTDSRATAPVRSEVLPKHL